MNRARPVPGTRTRPSRTVRRCLRRALRGRPPGWLPTSLMAGSQPTLYLTVAYKDRASQGSPVRASQRGARGRARSGRWAWGDVSVVGRSRSVHETLKPSRRAAARTSNSTRAERPAHRGSARHQAARATPRRRSSPSRARRRGRQHGQGSIRRRAVRGA